MNSRCSAASPNQSCGRFEKQQQGGGAPAGRVGGDTFLCRWRPTQPDSSMPHVILRPLKAALVAHGDTQFFFSSHSYIQSYLCRACSCQLAVKVLEPCLMSDRTLIRSRHHPAPSPPSVTDADPFFSLPLSISLSMSDSCSS